MGKKVSKGLFMSKQLDSQLKEEHMRWNELYEHGGSDPFWPDGVNLNLVRNHIIFYWKEIEENLKEEEYPESYSIPIPPEVEYGYMADREGILSDAIRTYETVRNTQDFRYLSVYHTTHRINGEIEKRLSIVRTMRLLKSAIDNDDYLFMRRYRDWKPLLVQMNNDRMELEKLEGVKKELPLGQLSIFDFL